MAMEYIRPQITRVKVSHIYQFHLHVEVSLLNRTETFKTGKMLSSWKESEASFTTRDKQSQSIWGTCIVYCRRMPDPVGCKCALLMWFILLVIEFSKDDISFKPKLSLLNHKSKAIQVNRETEDEGSSGRFLVPASAENELSDGDVVAVVTGLYVRCVPQWNEKSII